MTSPSDDPFQFFEPEPTPSEKALWTKFVQEYVKDFNAVEACVRVGFGLTYALVYAPIFLSKPFVIRAVADYKAKIPVNEKAEEDLDKSLVIATLREAAQNGKQRVAAALGLARIRGMDVPVDKSGDALQQLADDFKNLAKNLPD